MKHGIVCVADNLFETLFAISEEEQRYGLMYRDPPTPIMTFVYSQPQINKFWMNNTKAALDIVFCCNNHVTQICHGVPFSTTIIGDSTNSDLVIELPYGMAKHSEIKIGQNARIVKPNFNELKINS